MKAHTNIPTPLTTRLPHQLTIALGQYFLNYQLHQPQNVGSESRHVGGKLVTTQIIKQGRDWDKTADLLRIANALPKGWSYQACSGTFWIMSPNVKKHHYYIHNEIWPRAEIRKNS